MEIDEINSLQIGKKVSTIGYIISIRKHFNGHIFLTISNGKGRINVPLFSSLVDALNRNGINTKKLRKGIKIYVSGFVSEYKNRLQIIPRKPEDIKLLT